MDSMQTQSGSGSAVGTVPTAAISGFTSSVKEAVPAKASVIGDPEIAAATKLEPLEKTAVGENLATGESTGPDDRTSKVLDELNEQAKQSTGVAGETLSQASATVTEVITSATHAATELAQQAYDAVVGEKK